MFSQIKIILLHQTSKLEETKQGLAIKDIVTTQNCIVEFIVSNEIIYSDQVFFWIGGGCEVEEVEEVEDGRLVNNSGGDVQN